PDPARLARSRGELADALTRDAQQRDREHGRAACRPRKRAEDADPVAELRHHGDLHRARDSRYDCEEDDEGVHGAATLPRFGLRSVRPRPKGERRVIRVFVLYSEQPDPERYEQHVALARQQVPGAEIRHGGVLGGMPEPDAAYYFEYEFPDRDAWKAAQDGLMAGAQDAQGMGVEFRAYFAEIS